MVLHRNPKTLLTLPLWPVKKKWGFFQKAAGNCSFSTGLASIAAVVRNAGFPIFAKDTQVEGMGEQQFAHYLKEGKFDVIAMPCFIASVPFVKRTAQICRQILPNSKVVIGNIQPTMFPEETLSYCNDADIAVMGAGEYTFLEYLQYLRDESPELTEIPGLAVNNGGNVVINQPRKPMTEIDSLPMPAYDMFPMEKYVLPLTNIKRYPTYSIITSRGCPYPCGFCTGHHVHGYKVLHRSIEATIEEILYLKNRFNARGIMFHDSTFTVSRKWTIELCEALLKNNIDLPWMCFTRVDRVDRELLSIMKNAGCWAISFGIESGNQKSLDLIKKGTTVEQAEEAIRQCLELKIFVLHSFIMGLPGENEDDIHNTYKFAKKLGGHVTYFFLPVPFPGTLLHQLAKNDKGLKKDIAWTDYSDLKTLPYINPNIGGEKMLKLLRKYYIGYYSSPKIIYRNLKELNSIDAIKKYWTAAGALLQIIFQGE
ncbi:MAG: hypothetical protein A2161_02560 [Candidatus Schekmanbacteria bacterium RBG_13_48_7]|uniref:Uncharacterized protein n=1 Tax=Candidatus Schekmanbacteria bacterium RBG_13_48_7 TaxID=1817878 RepID=A0A1F7S0M2_9BACT|nr:MAG: hypothetical protein A2161_02560 [Candidatus Schekmanbacteria bacterium RBG_13_48_7]